MTTTRNRNHSYEVRDALADALGRRLYTDFSCEVSVTLAHPQSGDLDPTEAILTSTSNAGDRGIEGHFLLADGSRITRSLGLVTDWTV